MKVWDIRWKSALEMRNLIRVCLETYINRILYSANMLGQLAVEYTDCISAEG